MKKIFIIVLSMLLLCMPMVTKALATNSSYDNIKIYFFYEDECEDCDDVKKWLENELNEHNRVRAEFIAIDENKELYNEIKKTLNIKKDELPVIVIGSNYFIDFSNKQKNNLMNAIKAYEDAKDYCDIVSKIKDNGDTNNCLKENEGIYKEEFPLAIVIGASIGILVIIALISTYMIIKKKKN